MKWKAFVALAIVVTGLFGRFAFEIMKAQAITITETQITTNTARQWRPAIYGDRIVWEDNRNGNPDIYMCDLGARMFTVEARGQKYNLTINSNATITHVVATENTLHFELTGPIGQTASVNITIPVGLNTTAIKVIVNDVKLEPPPFPIITSNGTHYFIYFEFSLSTHDIIIRYGLQGDWLTSLIIGLSILLAVAVVTVVYVKKRKRHTEINS